MRAPTLRTKRAQPRMKLTSAQGHRLSETSGLDTPHGGRIEHRLNPAGELVAWLPQDQRDRVLAGRR